MAIIIMADTTLLSLVLRKGGGGSHGLSVPSSLSLGHSVTPGRQEAPVSLPTAVVVKPGWILVTALYFFLPSVKKLRRFWSSFFPSPEVAGSVCARVGDAASPPVEELTILIQVFISSCNTKLHSLTQAPCNKQRLT